MYAQAAHLLLTGTLCFVVHDPLVYGQHKPHLLPYEMRDRHRARQEISKFAYNNRESNKYSKRDSRLYGLYTDFKVSFLMLERLVFNLNIVFFMKNT